MGAAVTPEPKSKSKAEVSAAPAAPVPSAFDLEAAYGAPAGMPIFLAVGLQRKLAVGSVDDPLEREADHVAEQVMRMPDTGVITSSTMSGGHRRPDLGMAGTDIQRKCACGGSSSGQCEECKKQAEEPHAAPVIHRRTSGNGNGNGNHHGSGGSEAPPIVHQALSSPGHPLDASVRPMMESRFGHDFSDVRVHTDTLAAESAQTINALAYTAGRNVAFAAGQYSPGSGEGKRLLAHELTHVLQQSSDGLAVQRQQDKPDFDTTQLDLIQKALKSGDASDVKDINPFAFRLADDNQKIQLINILLNNSWGVGPNDGYYIEHIWASFGKNLVTVATMNIDLWNACNQHSFVDLYDLAELIPTKDQFRKDIVAQADDYLAKNRAKATQEIDRLGLADTNAAATAEQAKNVQQLQRAADKLNQAHEAQRRLEFAMVIYSFDWGRCVSGFNPEKPSPPPNNTCFNPTGLLNPNGFDRYPTWEKTHEEHAKVNAVINNLTSTNPVLYALFKEAYTGDLADLATTKDDKQARRTTADTLNAVIGNIDKTHEKLNDPKDDLPLELWPIHQQLMSTGTWAQPFRKLIAGKVVEQHKQDKFWESIGLGAFQAALFVVAELSTGGLATFFLAASAIVSGAQAVSSWQKYQELQQAAGTNLSDETSLITQGRVAEALLDAALATIFAFLDAYAVASAAGKAGSLEKLGQAEKAEAKEAEVPLRQATEPELQQETKLLEQKVANPENIQSVLDEELAKTYDVQIAIGEHTYYRRLDGGGWCRASGIAICGYSFGPEIEEALEKVRQARRPSASGKETEKYVEDFLGKEYEGQVPSFEGKDLGKGSQKYGMSISDFTAKGERRIVVEVKNIDIQRNIGTGFADLRDQIGKYLSNVPNPDKSAFWLFLDIRGQKLPAGGFKQIVDAVHAGTGAVFNHIYMITEAGVVVF
jgi:hypothetical protein